MAEPLRVLLAGGGTAGHVNPLLAVAAELRARRPDARLVVLGTAEGLEARLVPPTGLPLHVVPRAPLPRRPTPDLLRLPGRLRAAVEQAAAAIADLRPQVVLGFGGYVAAPAYLAAHRAGVPIVVHEQNTRPGLANRLGARWASAVAVTFAGTRLPHAQVTGLPLRAQVARVAADLAADRAGTRARAAQQLGLAPDRTTLLVTGGSLGAVSVNRAVADAAGALLAAGAQVLHLTGRDKAEPVRAALAGVPGAERYVVLDYLDRMDLALALADLVVARAGAGTVCELAALGVPAVYVPLPIGNGEQRRNASGVVAAGGGLLVDDAELTGTWVAQHVGALLADPERRAAMSAGAASVGVVDGAARVADLVERPAGRLPTQAPAGSAPVVPSDSVPPDAVATDAAPPDRASSNARSSGEVRSDAEPTSSEPSDVGRADAAPATTEPAPGTAPPPLDLTAVRRLHLVGVGGAGMSAIALLLAARGVQVSGSDAVDGPTLDGLRRAGVQVRVGHDASAVDGADGLVVSSAVRPDNPELVRAAELGLPVWHRSAALAALMVGRCTVAVAGAHGKTTTSAMIAVGLLHAGADPSFAIGGAVVDRDGPLGGARSGGGPFVAEADESDGSFLAYAPDVAVVTNVEADHLDHYGSREELERAFVRFAARITPGGALVVCADDPGAVALARAAARPGLDVVRYGRGAEVDVRVSAALPAGDGGWRATVDADGQQVEIALPVPGDHNALNAAGAFAVLRRLGVPAAAAATALGAFRSTGRRFEERGEAGGVRVLDDYAHHPTEVAALLRAARQVAGEGRVLALFQPHLYSRTRTFAAEFGRVFDLADEVVVTDVYAAREDPDPQVSGALVADAVPTPGKARYVADKVTAAHLLAADARPGDLVLTVGAGDVTTLGPLILADLAGRVSP